MLILCPSPSPSLPFPLPAADNIDSLCLRLETALQLTRLTSYPPQTTDQTPPFTPIPLANPSYPCVDYSRHDRPSSLSLPLDRMSLPLSAIDMTSESAPEQRYRAAHGERHGTDGFIGIEYQS